jgi:hypothetical protein
MLGDKDMSLKKEFKFLSENGEGAITLYSLVRSLRQELNYKISKEGIEAIMRRCDHDGDNKISFVEFKELLTTTESNKKAAPGIQDQSVERRNVETYLQAQPYSQAAAPETLIHGFHNSRAEDVSNLIQQKLR